MDTPEYEYARRLEPSDDTHATVTPSEPIDAEDSMLPRDHQRKTAYYDYSEERQMSQTESKLFYQPNQLESHMTGGGSSTWGNSQIGIDSPTLLPLPRSLSNKFEPTIEQLPGPTLGPGSAGVGLSGFHRNESLLRADQAAREHGVHPDLPHEQKGSLGAEGLHGAGAGVGIGNGAGGFADSDARITEELRAIYTNIQKILDVRHKYMRLSLQGEGDNPKDEPNWDIYPPPPEPAWYEEGYKPPTSATQNNSMANSLVLPSLNGDAHETSKAHRPKRKPGKDIGEDFEMEDLMPLPGPGEMTFRLDSNSVYQVYENSGAEKSDSPAINIPTIKEYYMDMEEVLKISSDGPSKSFAFRRLLYLEGKFDLYKLLNEYQEMADSKRVPHRDFYNVRKVDTHVHHSACMNQKHLLRFIKSKMKKCPDEVVMFRDSKHLTLAEVFQSINLTAYDLSIDTLDMHAHTDAFHRFDKFNLKYNPVGESRLRTIFLKTDNFINGRYLAELTKEVVSDLESSKYQMVEWRISVYGRDLQEWDKLAAWVVDNKLFSHNVRWLIQVPRLFDVYKSSALMENFEQVIVNLFQPLFEVTKDPSSHPKLHIFLQRVIGFDSVDDESKAERRLYKKFPVPNFWDSAQNPPYSYWIYYLFANMASLNVMRKQRGFNTFLLRPHCGEAGDTDHLAAAVICCHSISHGILLRKVPLLQYVFYLEQIGVAMSPLSNNALFLAYERNPFQSYFKRGLNVSLSTDDPLQFAFTKEPLIEEYSVAAQIYKLSAVDMCELAKNSVKQSGFEYAVKARWLGSDFHLPGVKGNAMAKTNVPNIREGFRHETLLQELSMIERYAGFGAAPVTPIATTISESPKGPRPISPTSSMRTNYSSNTTTREGSQYSQQYKQFPAQSARIPVSHSALQLDTLGSQNSSSPSQPQLAAREHQARRSSLTSPQLASLNRDNDAYPIQGFSDLHLSGSEPRIFPGVVSRTQRRDTLGNTPVHKRGKSTISKASLDGADDADDADDAISDEDMEEAGGMDE